MLRPYSVYLTPAPLHCIERGAGNPYLTLQNEFSTEAAFEPVLNIVFDAVGGGDIFHINLENG